MFCDLKIRVFKNICMCVKLFTKKCITYHAPAPVRGLTVAVRIAAAALRNTHFCQFFEALASSFSLLDVDLFSAASIFYLHTFLSF